MTLKSNELGFLVGESPQKDGGDTLALDILKAIKGDTGAIRDGIKRSAVEVRRTTTIADKNTVSKQSTKLKAANEDLIVAAVKKATKDIESTSKKSQAASKRARGADGRFLSNKPTDDTKAVKAVEKAVNAIEKAAEASNKAEAENVKRGADGRFRKGYRRDGTKIEDEPESKDKDDDDDDENPNSKDDKDRFGGLKKVAEVAASGAVTAGTDVEKIDPLIEAGREMKDVGSNVMGFTKALFSPLAFLKKDDDAKKSVGIQAKMLKKLKEIEQQKGGKNGKKGIFSAIKGKIGGILLTALMALFTPVGTLLKAAFMGSGKLLFSALRVAFLPVAGVLTAAFGGWKIGSWFYEKYGTQIQDGIEAIETGAKDAFKWVKDSWNNAVEKVTSTFEQLKNDFSKLPDRIIDAMKPDFMKNSSASREKELSKFATSEGMGVREKELFMKSASEQTGGFMSMDNDLNLTPQALLDKYKGRNGLENIEQARNVVAGGESSIIEAIYGGEYGKSQLGNTAIGDAAKYRGRGYAGLAGKANYEAAGKKFNLDLIGDPSLAAKPENAAKIAAWKWQQTGAKTAAKTGNGVGKPSLQITNAISSMMGGNSTLSSILGGTTNSDFISSSIVSSAENGAISPIMAGGDALNGNGMVTSANVKTMPIPKAAPIKVPLGTSSTTKDRKSSTMIQLPQIGQNMSDRSIAQVVTGGMGNNN